MKKFILGLMLINLTFIGFSQAHNPIERNGWFSSSYCKLYAGSSYTLSYFYAGENSEEFPGVYWPCQIDERKSCRHNTCMINNIKEKYKKEKITELQVEKIDKILNGELSSVIEAVNEIYDIKDSSVYRVETNIGNYYNIDVRVFLIRIDTEQENFYYYDIFEVTGRRQ